LLRFGRREHRAAAIWLITGGPLLSVAVIQWNHPDVLDEEPYALVVTVADRDNEDAQLYTQTQAVIAQQAEVRER